MIIGLYQDKKELKKNIGNQLKYNESRLFNNEYINSGMNNILINNKNKKEYGQVILCNGVIQSVI